MSYLHPGGKADWSTEAAEAAGRRRASAGTLFDPSTPKTILVEYDTPGHTKTLFPSYALSSRK
jgi:hypothetical protein